MWKFTQHTYETHRAQQTRALVLRGAYVVRDVIHTTHIWNTHNTTHICNARSTTHLRAGYAWRLCCSWHYSHNTRMKHTSHDTHMKHTEHNTPTHWLCVAPMLFVTLFTQHTYETHITWHTYESHRAQHTCALVVRGAYAVRDVISLGCSCEASYHSFECTHLKRETWLIHTCDMTHSYMWHDSFVHVTWLIPTCDVISLVCSCEASYHSFKCTRLHDSSRLMTCDMTHSYMWHDSFTWYMHHDSLTSCMWLIYFM